MKALTIEQLSHAIGHCQIYYDEYYGKNHYLDVLIMR